MTEQDAKKKWCPMVRFNYCGSDMTDVNRPSEMDSMRCIASDCMMWRWDMSEMEYFCPECGADMCDALLKDKTDTRCDGANYCRKWLREHGTLTKAPRINRSGHCGLAGTR